MSFPSVAEIAALRGFSVDTLSAQDAKEVLIAAVERDCPQAIEFLRIRADEARESGQPVTWSEDPNSVLGKQLIRIHASDAVRPLVQKHICHGKQLSFVNCCSGQVGGGKLTEDELVVLQIQCQAGPLAYADC